MAVSDAMGVTAQGLTTLKRGPSLAHDLDRLVALVKTHQISELVIGLPKNMDGTLGSQAEKVQEFIQHLRAKIHLPVHLWDERLTTVAAHKAMLEADLSRRRRKQAVDMVAAVLILQGYLDWKSNQFQTFI